MQAASSTLTIMHITFSNFTQNIIAVYSEINNQVTKLSGLPIVIQNIGLALLTILIPLAIVILTEVYKDRGNFKNSEKPFTELDLHVIVDHIFKVKRLVLYSIMIFLPLAFWELWAGRLQLILLVISIISLVYTISIILNVYKWTKGNILTDIFDFRFAYLRKKKLDEIKEVWQSIWSCKDIDLRKEREFLNIFLSKIDSMLKEEPINFQSLSITLNDFVSNFRNRSSFLLAMNTKILQKILDWHLTFWRWFKQSLKKDEVSDDFGSLYVIPQDLDKVINEIAEKCILQGNPYGFFPIVQEHMMKNRKEQIEIKKENGVYIHIYVQDLVESISKFLFKDLTDWSKSSLIWENIPNEWKVTKSNIKNRDIVEWQFLLKEFTDRFIDGIIFKKREQRKVTGIIPWLFPEVDSSKFAILLFFYYTGADNKVKTVIEEDWGILSYAMMKAHVFTSMDELENQLKLQQESETEATFDLIYSFSDFRTAFTEDKLNEYLATAKALDYPVSSAAENRKETLIEIFQEMLVYLKTAK